MKVNPCSRLPRPGVLPATLRFAVLGALLLGALPLWAADAATVSAAWKRRVYAEDRIVESPTTRSADGAARLTVDFSEGVEYFCEPDLELGAYDRIEVLLDLPPGFPRAALIYVWVKDWDDFWYQALITPEAVKTEGAPKGRVRLSIPLTGEAAAKAWQPGRGHYRQWSQVSPDQIEEFGLKFDSPTGKPVSFAGEVLLRRVSVSRLAAGEAPPPRVTDFRVLTEEPQVGKRVELALELTHPYRRPFDPSQVDIQATITAPNGDEQAIRAFYFEDFLFDEESARSELVPWGRPQFRLRHTPLEPGEHHIQISGSIGDAVLKLPPLALQVAPAAPDWQGFVRASPQDSRLLTYSRTGNEFQGIGINVRSPYDTRYMEAFGFSGWESYNLLMYKQLFARYQAAGINVVEVWMSPWWLALEWMDDAPGNHGVGHYNQFRAWKLDRLFEWAQEYDITLILVFNNHGKFSAWCDPDWQRNPYNQAQGGKLESPEDYFTDGPSRDATKRLLDYIVARWGHEPRLLAWKLFTEINLTGKNDNWFRTVSMANWHREMGGYLKSIDPNQHLVTTHWSTSFRKAQESPLITGAAEMDMLTLDIYYAGVGANRLWADMRATLQFMNSLDKPKPCLITEFGGSPWADSLDHIRNQLHIGLWSGWFGVMATPPCFWWFPLVDEQDLYPDYRGLRNFIDGESRHWLASDIGTVPETSLQQMRLRVRTAEDERGSKVAVADTEFVAGARDRQLIWLFDEQYYFAGNLNLVPTRFTDQKLPISDLDPGIYAVEYWNPSSGEKTGYDRIEIKASTPVSLTLPVFEKDIAVKLKRIRN